jgi:hypothetical protein
VAAAIEHYDDVGLLYVDGGQDLMIPTDHPEEPILDAMGVAHMLGVTDWYGDRPDAVWPWARVCWATQALISAELVETR